ncbi:NXPE family member 2-like isoform X3 [Hemicordylus capensis]|uniref:NXPE family member 2-like isoform X3 n=1 Tax=Hemicordylus capensis TaxID=884348 RepID=UPI002303E6BF|nr:NXPE family member 2-like isoform X3 [Hemicordylus capensis]
MWESDSLEKHCNLLLMKRWQNSAIFPSKFITLWQNSDSNHNGIVSLQNLVNDSFSLHAEELHPQKCHQAVRNKASCYRCGSNVGVEIPQHLGEIRVLPCNRTRQVPSKKCAVGMSSPSPSGFVWQDHWHPVFCSVSTFETSVQINSCLKRKLVYFMGDSTVRQWLWNLTKRVSTLKYLDIHKFGNLKNGLAMDVSRSILIQFKKHGHPYVSSHAYTVTDHSYIAREIDSVAGDKDTAVVISLGQHFRPFPLELFVRRLINVRAAIQRLLLRSPETRVIIKAENIREMDAEPERFGDFHGYTQYLAAKDVFRGLNVGMVDAWDMTLASATSNVHPPHYVVGNQVEMFLTYIC